MSVYIRNRDVVYPHQYFTQIPYHIVLFGCWFGNIVITYQTYPYRILILAQCVGSVQFKGTTRLQYQLIPYIFYPEMITYVVPILDIDMVVPDSVPIRCKSVFGFAVVDYNIFEYFNFILLSYIHVQLSYIFSPIFHFSFLWV